VTERSRFDRAWPSLLALVGTVAVVLALLWAFGSDIDPDSSDEDPVAEDGDLPDDGADEDSDDTGDGEDGEPDEPAEDEPTEQSESPAEPVTAPPELRTQVGILNATAIAGLAARAQERFEEGGWSVPAIDSTSRDVDATTVYYPTEDLMASAEALAAQFPEIVQVEPTVTGLAQDRLVVILGPDYAEAVGDTG
jgi:hypothetical protein